MIMIVVILIVHILIVFILQVQRSEDVLPPKEPEPTQVIDTSEDEQISEKPSEEDSKVKPKAEEEVILIMFISSCVHLDCNHLVFYYCIFLLFLFYFIYFTSVQTRLLGPLASHS